VEGKSRFNGKTPSGLGGRLYLNGNKYIDAWESGQSTVGPAYNFKAGQPIQVKLEYFQANTDGNPSVALLWSLLPSQSSDSITPAINEIATADAVIVLVGGANNDQTGTTEGASPTNRSLMYLYLDCLTSFACLLHRRGYVRDETFSDGLEFAYLFACLGSTGVDRASLSLAGEQMALVERADNASRVHHVPMVTVLVDGKPTAEPGLKNLGGALLAAFQGGQAAVGSATQPQVLCCVVFRCATFELTVSFPRTAGCWNCGRHRWDVQSIWKATCLFSSVGRCPTVLLQP
jgi:hypothetical protein